MQQDLGQFDAAIASFEQVLQLQPDNVDACVGLGSALCAAQRREEAIAVYQRALVLAPDCVELHYNLGNALMIQNRIEQSVASYREALRLQPDNAIAFSNLLFTLQNWPDYPQDDLLREHLAYAERFEAPIKLHWQPHRNARQPDRRLRVGYVSGDFRQHPVAHFIEPILAHHDKAQVEVFGYYNHGQVQETAQKPARPPSPATWKPRTARCGEHGVNIALCEKYRCRQIPIQNW